MLKRSAKIQRKTKETNISLKFTIDGTGKTEIKTTVPFFDHMLTLFAVHGLFDIEIAASGDTDIDFHHLVEDIGICLGQAFSQSLGNAKEITRFASGLIPMDESLCQLAVDLSNRPYLSIKKFPKGSVGNFDLELIQEFLQSFTFNAKFNLHIEILSGTNKHHVAESCFKALGIVLDKATRIDPRKKNIPSTKGVL